MSGLLLQRPVGLVLSGGGALGSWQSAVIHALEKRHGVVFDAVLGFSAGALNGVSYFLSRMDETLERWRGTDGGVLRPAPRLFPLSIFSNSPIWEAVEPARDDDNARRRGRCRLVVVSAHRHREDFVYAEYAPDGRAWDGPLARHLVASCSIPVVFPPMKVAYRGEEALLVDGGVPCRRPMSFASLADCRDVLILEMVRAEEVADGIGLPWPDRMGRITCRRLMDQGVASLKALPAPPRVFRLAPSQVLDFAMLSFRRRHIERGLALGAADADAFAVEPRMFLA